MTDRPIIFSAPMVLAMLAGRKTQTRRLTVKDNMKTGAWRETGWQKVRAGDRLYVQEAWRTEARHDHLKPRDVPPDALRSFEADYNQEPDDGCRGRYRYARFMPRRLSRITLTVTDVRVQRLNAISEEDAQEEGWQAGVEGPYLPGTQGDAMGWFAAVWNSLHGPDAWEANPFIIALSFSVEHRNIDAQKVAA